VIEFLNEIVRPIINPYIMYDPEMDIDKCCENPNIFLSSQGNYVCLTCGVDHGIQISETERRAYSREEVSKRKLTEPVLRNYGSRTIIKPSFTYNRKRQGNSSYFTRLSRINSSLDTTVERNYWQAYPLMKLIAQKVEIPTFVFETSWKVYSECVKLRLTAGRSIIAFICSSLYVGCRIHKFPRLMDEFLDYCDASRRVANKTLSLILLYALPGLGESYKYKSITITELIHKFCAELDFSISIRILAIRMLEEAKNNGLKGAGKDPKGLSAGFLYIASKQLDDKRGQKEFAKKCRITEVTLRNGVKQIQDRIKT